MGGTGIFMRDSKDSFENKAVGFNVGPLKAAMKMEFRRTVLLSPENHRIATCQLVR